MLSIHTLDFKVHRISNYTDIADSDKYIAILKRRQLYIHTFNSIYHIRCHSSVSRRKKTYFRNQYRDNRQKCPYGWIKYLIGIIVQSDRTITDQSYTYNYAPLVPYVKVTQLFLSYSNLTP